MAQLMANDLTSPVNLLWAHQLRREHAAVVRELDNLKQTCPSAADHNDLALQVRDKDANIAKMRKELDDLKAAHHKAIEAFGALKVDLEKEKLKFRTETEAQEERQNAVYSRLDNLNQCFERQDGELREVASEIRQKIAQSKAKESPKKGTDISELHELLKALDRKLDGAVVVVKDSLEQREDSLDQREDSLEQSQDASEGMLTSITREQPNTHAKTRY